MSDKSEAVSVTSKAVSVNSEAVSVNSEAVSVKRNAVLYSPIPRKALFFLPTGSPTAEYF